METSSTVDSVKGVINGIKIAKKVLALLNIKTLIIAIIVLIIIMAIGMLSSTHKSGTSGGAVKNINLSASTLQWQNAVQEEATKQGVSDLVPYIMAIIEVETKGQGNDIMQSSESAGLGPNGITDPLQSITQGVKTLKNEMLLGKSLGFSDSLAIVQSYNFGSSYISYLVTTNQTHSIDVAEKYSKDVVAPSLGNTTGETNSYVNAVSQSYGKTYLYVNGGNFYYAELVKQYITSGSSNTPVGGALFQSVIGEALKYQGWSYSWGGSNPSTGFDCSGLVQWTYGKAGISLPRTANDQWTVTQQVSLQDAQPGDLIFFKGTYGEPDFISHVGIYVDPTTMYDADDSGIGYHNWTNSYWMAHFDSIRRVAQ